jgi:hypothetical protein
MTVGSRERVYGFAAEQIAGVRGAALDSNEYLESGFACGRDGH